MKQPYNTTIYNTALYMRLSRDDENYGDSVSIETQRTILQQYAKEQGLHVVGEYVDDGWSGTNFERPDFQRMMDDVEAGKVNCIVTKDLSPFRAGTCDDGLLSGISVPREACALHRHCRKRGHRKRAVRFRPFQKPVQRVVCKRYKPQGKGRFQSKVCHRTAYRRLCSHRVQETPGNQKQADNRRGNPLDSGEDF